MSEEKTLEQRATDFAASMKSEDWFPAMIFGFDGEATVSATNIEKDRVEACLERIIHRSFGKLGPEVKVAVLNDIMERMGVGRFVLESIKDPSTKRLEGKPTLHYHQFDKEKE